MPETHTTPTTTWSLPELDDVEIRYTTDDRFGGDRRYGDPHQAHAQHVRGEIVGVTYDHEGSGPEVRTPLGTLSLALVDLYEVDDLGLHEVLDSNSSEWNNYYGIVEQVNDEDLIRTLVILDRVELVPEARGNDLGLHVLARAIRTWAPDEALVVLTAGSALERDDDESDEAAAKRRAAAEAIACHWQRLGFERVELGPEHFVGGTVVPVLYATTNYQTFLDTIEQHFDWTSPAQTKES